MCKQREWNEHHLLWLFRNFFSYFLGIFKDDVRYEKALVPKNDLGRQNKTSAFFAKGGQRTPWSALRWHLGLAYLWGILFKVQIVHIEIPIPLMWILIGIRNEVHTHSLRFRLALSGVLSPEYSRVMEAAREKLGSGMELPILCANRKPSPFWSSVC